MDSTDKLIEQIKNDPLLSGIELTHNNVRDAFAFLEMTKICQNCQGLFECGLPSCGMKPVLTNDRLSFQSCQFLLTNKSYDNVNHRFASNYIKAANFTDFNCDTINRKKCLDFGRAYLQKPTANGLYIYGNFGTGKTYILSALANELAQKSIKSIIVFMPDLSRNLKSSMNDYSLESKVNELKMVDVLMLDDFGGEMMTSWLRDEIIAPIIQYRCINNLPIFISSNLDYSLLRNHLSQTKDDLDSLKANRILERIKKMTKRVCLEDVYKG